MQTFTKQYKIICLHNLVSLLEAMNISASNVPDTRGTINWHSANSTNSARKVAASNCPFSSAANARRKSAGTEMKVPRTILANRFGHGYFDTVRHWRCIGTWNYPAKFRAKWNSARRSALSAISRYSRWMKVQQSEFRDGRHRMALRSFCPVDGTFNQAKLAPIDLELARRVNLALKILFGRELWHSKPDILSGERHGRKKHVSASKGILQKYVVH